MKKITILFSFILFFYVTSCSTFQENESPTKEAETQAKDSPASSASKRDVGSITKDSSNSRTSSIDLPSEVIDLNQVQIVPMPNPESKFLQITKNKDGNPIVLLSLETSNSGLDLVGSILKGEILEHAIVIRNEKGEEIGRSPINVLEYQIEEIATNKGEKKILLTESGSEIGIKKTNELPPVVKKAKVRTFGKNELISQYIELQKTPKEGGYVSVTIEALYTKPFAELDCYSSEAENADSSCSRDFHKNIKTEIQTKVSEKESILTKAISEMKDENTIPKEYREQLALRLGKPTNEYRSEIKSNVSAINNDKLKNQTKGSYYYREWKLSNIPKYFQVTYADTPQPEKKKRVKTDYTYFDANEKSTEAIEEISQNKNIVIEVNTGSESNGSSNLSSSEKAQMQDAQKVSLEQAKRQEIGVGSQCVIYLKSGKFFTAKIVSLDAYETIQVDVNGNVIDVPKKSIEVIYIPKSSTD